MIVNITKRGTVTSKHNPNVPKTDARISVLHPDSAYAKDTNSKYISNNSKNLVLLDGGQNFGVIL